MMTFRTYSILFSAMLMLGACRQRTEPMEAFSEFITLQLDSLNRDLDDRLQVALTASAPADTLQRLFFASRIRYKRIEHVLEYYAPATTRFINGPALDELEIEEHKTSEPEGFQVLEELIFADTINYEVATAQLRILRINLKRVKIVWKNAAPNPEQLFDALRLEMFRIISLGMGGFDSPVALNAMPEAAASLCGIRETLPFLETASSRQAFTSLHTAIRSAETYLLSNADFDTFNRALFIRRYANTISHALAEARQARGVLPVTTPGMLKSGAVTLFDENAFNADFYLSAAYPHDARAIVALGRALFFDPILSNNNNRACVSCHQPQRAFTDGQKKNRTLTGTLLLRNTPTLINAAFQNAQFYDMRSSTLEVQARDVVENPHEMHGSLATAAQRLMQTPSYQAAFKKAFDQDDSITTGHLQFALASYVRTLQSFNSAFDRYMRGDSTQLSADQQEGFNLFMGKGRCGFCHFTPLFNGSVPPFFADTEAEVIGVPATIAWSAATIDPDEGRYHVTQMEQLRFAFKTPTLRNAALTAPYMHNGVYQTLLEVLKFYNKGGGAGIGITLPNQTLPTDTLGLTNLEQGKIIAFIHSLTDTTGLTSKTDVRY